MAHAGLRHVQLVVQPADGSHGFAIEAEAAPEDGELEWRHVVEQVRRRGVQRQGVEVDLGIEVDHVDRIVLLGRRGCRPAGIAGPEGGRHVSVVAPQRAEVHQP